MKQQEKKPLIILTGPTAAGKTSLSIELAKSIGGEIISADSMQVYKKMDIGTAKIRLEEMQGAVSYTHLDVYKRQVCSCEFRGNRTLRLSIWHDCEWGIITVSS